MTAVTLPNGVLVCEYGDAGCVSTVSHLEPSATERVRQPNSLVRSGGGVGCSWLLPSVQPSPERRPQPLRVDAHCTAAISHRRARTRARNSLAGSARCSSVKENKRVVAHQPTTTPPHKPPRQGGCLPTTTGRAGNSSTIRYSPAPSTLHSTPAFHPKVNHLY